MTKEQWQQKLQQLVDAWAKYDVTLELDDHGPDETTWWEWFVDFVETTNIEQ